MKLLLALLAVLVVVRISLVIKIGSSWLKMLSVSQQMHNTTHIYFLTLINRLQKVGAKNPTLYASRN